MPPNLKEHLPQTLSGYQTHPDAWVSELEVWFGVEEDLNVTRCMLEDQTYTNTVAEEAASYCPSDLVYPEVILLKNIVEPLGESSLRNVFQYLNFSPLSVNNNTDMSVSSPLEDQGGGVSKDHSRLSTPEREVKAEEARLRAVVVSLLSSCMEAEEDVRTAAASSLALIAEPRPLLVLTEWHSAFSREKQTSSSGQHTGPVLSKRKSTASPTPSLSGLLDVPSPVQCLVQGLAPVMEHIVVKNSLNASDVRHRAILGQIMATLVEEMVGGVGEKTEKVCQGILVSLSASYMDKVMDVLLVHYQPSSGGSVQPVVVDTLASLAHHQPQGCVPFLKAILSTTSHVIKAVKVNESQLRSSFAASVSRFSDAILDYVSNIEEMPDTTVTVSHFHTEANSIYDTLFSSWLSNSKEVKVKLQALECLAATTPLLSPAHLTDKGALYLSSLLSLYKKLGSASGSNLEISLCLSQLLDMVTQVEPVLLDPVLDPVFNTMFQQVCLPTDYGRPHTVKNRNEILRCYDTMMRFKPEKLVSGLLTKVDAGEERVKVGALLVVKHILNMPTECLGERLVDIQSNLASRLGETNPNVQRVLAQIVVLLGNHGCIAGDQGRELVDFIIRICSAPENNTSIVSDTSVASEPSLAEMCGNILQLLTTSLPSVEGVLWPNTLDYLMQPDCDLAVPAVSRSLAHLATRRLEAGQDLGVDWGEFRFVTGPTQLLARLLVLASVPQTGGRGVHILRFLLKFSQNINRHLSEVWEGRFPLLLHYLEQHQDGGVDLGQWQDWLLNLVTDSVLQVGMEDWSLGLVSALVSQMGMYSTASREKSFCVRCVGQVLTLVTSKQVVLDHLSSIFLVSVDRKSEEDEACAAAFGVAASAHLELVMTKLETLYVGQVGKKSTSFFGLLRDRSSEEHQARVIALILQCVGKAASNASTKELETSVATITQKFLVPCLADCRNSNTIRESVLTAVSTLSVALQAVLQDNPSFVLQQHEEMLHSAIGILQDSTVSLSCKQLALHTLTCLIQLPPNISQLSRCALLKACFSTIFSTFLEMSSSKTEDYQVVGKAGQVVSKLEQQLGVMVEKLHVLIKELLRQDMEQSTVDEIFTMLEPWLRLEQDLSRELSVNILLGALETYVRGVRLGVNSPSNFTPGPYMIGAMVPRCHDPSRAVRSVAMHCLQHLLRILALYEGLAQETVEQALVQLANMNNRCNGEEAGRLEAECVSQALISVLNERVQHHHILSLVDSLCEAVLDTQVMGAAGAIAVLKGLVVTRGSEIFQNIPGFIRKLHDKMSLMRMDELSDLLGEVASVVQQFTVHSCRGVISSLLHLELPFDPAARLIWQSLAADPRLSADVLDVLLETIDHQTETSSQPALAAAAALAVMFEKEHRLEEVCRLEVGRIVSSLVKLLASSLTPKVASKGPVVQLDPVSISLDAMKALFSCLNCVVVAGSLTCPSLTDYSQLVVLLAKLVSAVAQHAPHHLSAIVSSQLATNPSTSPECVRVASLAMLQASVDCKAAGDLSLLASVLQALLRATSDPCPLARRLALQALPGLAHCTPSEIENYSGTALSALLAGLEDEQCSVVSLTSLQSMVTLLPKVPAHHVHPVTASLALKVRPFFESSSDEHRAAAIAIYGALATFAEGDHRLGYLEHAQAVLVPVLLHSSSPHTPTSQACLDTLKSLAKVTQFSPLIQSMASFNPSSGFAELVRVIVSARCGALVEMYPTTVANCVSYFKSHNPMLRQNVVTLLGAVLDATKGQDVVQEELVAASVAGMVDLLKDPDMLVRRVSAGTVGKVVLAANI